MKKHVLSNEFELFALPEKCRQHLKQLEQKATWHNGKRRVLSNALNYKDFAGFRL